MEGSIAVMTDSRNACRKNSYLTDHVAIGQKSHKVVDIQHVTKEDVCSQRHEKVTCDRMYQDLDHTGIAVSEHVHDWNVSINTILKTRGIRNVNERWHVTKSITAGRKQLEAGTKRSLGSKQLPSYSFD